MMENTTIKEAHNVRQNLLDGFYPYGFKSVFHIFADLLNRFKGIPSLREGDKGRDMGFEFVIPHTEQRVVVSFTPWREPTNVFVDISFTMVAVHDDKLPIVANNCEGWDFYYVPFCIPRSYNHSTEDDGTWPIPDLINKIEDFILDTKRTEKKYTLENSSDLGGKFPGGVATVSANYVPPEMRKWERCE